MTTLSEIAKLKRLIKKHTEAQVALSWSAYQDLEDRPKIQAEANRAKKAMNDHIKTLSYQLSDGC